MRPGPRRGDSTHGRSPRATVRAHTGVRNPPGETLLRPRAQARAAAAAAAALLLSGCAFFGYPAPPPPGPASAAAAPVVRPAPAPRPAAAGNPAPAPGPAAPSAAAGSYVVRGERYYVLPSAEGYVETGLASWYGEAFEGLPTSSGEPYDPRGMTAAHRSLPLSTWVEVTNLSNGRSIVVRVNDRGPFAEPHLRIIDLSREGARQLGFENIGLARVEVRALPGPPE